MKSKMTRKDALQLSKRLVYAWESMADRARNFAALATNDQGLQESLAKQFESDMRRLMGGEEVYLACKKFLEENSD